jgi:hypothetical protein
VESEFHFLFQVQQLHTLPVEMVMTTLGEDNRLERMGPEMVVVQDLQVVQV